MQAEKRKVVLYCRVATSGDYAIEKQRNDLQNFAAAQGFNNCVEYIDNGASAISLDRPAFSKLNNDIITEEIQAVFATSVSRIDRNSIAIMSWLDRMKELGVEVVSQHNDLEFNNILLPLFGEIMKCESEVGKYAS